MSKVKRKHSTTITNMERADRRKKNMTAKLYLPKNTDKIKYLLKTHSRSFTHTLYASDLTKKMNELTSLSLCVFQSRRELDVSLDFHGVCCWRLSVFRKSLLHSWKAHHHLKTERAAYLYCRKRNTMRLFKSLFFTHLLSSVFLLLFYCFEMRFLSRFVLFFVASLLLKFFRLCVIPSPSAFYHCFHQIFVFASRVFFPSISVVYVYAEWYLCRLVFSKTKLPTDLNVTLKINTQVEALHYKRWKVIFSVMRRKSKANNSLIYNVYIFCQPIFPLAVLLLLFAAFCQRLFATKRIFTHTYFTLCQKFNRKYSSVQRSVEIATVSPIMLTSV